MKLTWIVGASSGIGRALALQLSKQGHSLILSARGEAKLNELKEGIGDNCYIFPFDVSDNNAITSAWNQIERNFQTISTVIYCAGYYEAMSADNFKLDVVERIMDVNLLGAFRILNHVIPHFIKQRRGYIVLIGSIAGYRGLPNAIGYGASKAGLIHLAENLKCDLEKYNIDVQVINPGFVKTQLTDQNTFPMPFIISPETAAQHIANTIKKKSFESRFPFLFANGLKLLSKLPYWLYFFIIRKTTK